MPKYFDQVDFSNDPLIVDGNFTGLTTIVTSNTVKSGSGYLNGITINNRIGQNIYIYDSTSKVNLRATASQAIGTVGVLSFPANNTIAPRFIPFERKFTKGLIVIVKPTISTSVTNISISYR